MNNPLSRRVALKSIALIGLAATPFQQALAATRRAQVLRLQDAPPLPPRWKGEPLGRVTIHNMNARIDPTTESDIASDLVQDDLVWIRGAVQGQRVFWHNDIWLDTDKGWLYSSYIQPMWVHLPQVPHSDLGEGMWAEVIVPFTDATREPGNLDKELFVSRQYYSSVYYLDQLVKGHDGKMWYHVRELYQDYYMRATHLRIIPPEALTLLSPQVDPRDKRIEVDLAEQTLIAYEGNTPVFAQLVSTGVTDWATPSGNFYINDKRPGTRMIGGAADADSYDLPGVPFTCYFTWEWAATHGAYWHNDFGTPRSHGCVNLPSDAARWIWRWTTPVADYHALYFRPESGYDGTAVIVG
jgi:hypothetical protein